MKRSTKKGFTIVELVIVIAVIAILAAVLIPTFSSLIKKANLSSDMQAVRTINLALQTYEAENGKPANVDQAMLIIEEAGYDVATYHPLTKGYEIYWVDTVNRVILYSTTDKTVVYPDDYLSLVNNDGSWHTLNESYKEAVKYNFESQDSAVEVVGKTDDKISSITFKEVKTDEEAKDAGSALYAIFVQQNEGILPKDVNITLPEKVDVTNYIWKPVTEFTGNLIGAEGGTTISNVTLDESVSFTQSYQFDGSVDTKKGPSKYNVYGFIDSVSGNATIENLKFENFTLTTPGTDYANAGVALNANVLAPIGCIIPGENGEEAQVKISNVHVMNGTIEGVGRAAGLVGYIGGFGGSGTAELKGSVTIENCKVDGVTIKAGLASPAYGTAGGLVSYIVRAKDLTVDIKGCSVTNCKIEGTAAAAGVVGWFNPTPKDEQIFNLNIEGLELTNNTIKRTGGESVSSVKNYAAALIAGVDSNYYSYFVTVNPDKTETVNEENKLITVKNLTQSNNVITTDKYKVDGVAANGTLDAKAYKVVTE